MGVRVYHVSKPYLVLIPSAGVVMGVFVFINHIHCRLFSLPKMNINSTKVFINCIVFV